MAATRMTAEGIAAGAVLASLFDALVRKDIFTRAEVQEIAGNALQGLGLYTDTPKGFEASKLIADLSVRFAEGG